MEAKFKILSIDGGGIKGIIPCKILEFIEEHCQPRSISNLFDLIAGTSTGGIIGLGLSSKDPETQMNYTASKMLKLYQNEGAKIFNQREAKPKLDYIGLRQKPYFSADIEEILERYFGTTALDEVHPHNLLITTFDIEQNKPFFFSSRLAKKDSSNENFYIKDIAQATSAAPTFFKPIIIEWVDKTKGQLAFIDGGVFANNPSIYAYGEAKELWKNRASKGFMPATTKDDNDLPFYMLSIGTGLQKKKIDGDAAQDFRTMNWLEPLLEDIFMDGVAKGNNYAMEHLLPPYEDETPRYQRINVDIPEGHKIKMDDASPQNIELLCKIADDYIEKNQSVLLEICQLLK